VVRLLVSHETCIRSRVNGNAAIDGRSERNRKRLRSTGLEPQFCNHSFPCFIRFGVFIF